jgi:ferritin-like metal-binding protein YciE
VERLDKIATLVGKKLTGKSCVGMKGVLEEGSEVLKETDKGTIRDAALIGAAQRVEHYEMAGYGTARDFAKTPISLLRPHQRFPNLQASLC